MMTENRVLVRCKYCKNERGTGFDAWCGVGIKKHSMTEQIYCDAFVEWNHDKSNEYREIEINENGNQIILWKNNNMGQKFNPREFIKFLNEKING